MVLKRNTGYFLKNVYLLTISSLHFLRNYKRLKEDYRTFLNGLGKDDFWRKTFQA